MTVDQPGAYAEQRVLGILLAHPEALNATRLRAEDFCYSDHETLFTAIRDCKSGDVLVLAELVGDDVAAYASELAVHQSFAPENLSGYARRVRECAEARRFASSVARLRSRQRYRQRVFEGL